MAKHAYLSASASHRWLACPPSAKLCAQEEDRNSEYAIQGTCAHELAQHLVEKAMGYVYYPTDPSKIKGREFSRSLYVAEDVKTGDVISEQNVRSVRPGYGMHPKFLPELMGNIFIMDCKKGERMTLDLVR